MQVRWEYLTPPEFKKLVKEEQICILPLGILERHGEHLPYGTDGLSVHAIACRAPGQYAPDAHAVHGDGGQRPKHIGDGLGVEHRVRAEKRGQREHRREVDGLAPQRKRQRQLRKAQCREAVHYLVLQAQGKQRQRAYLDGVERLGRQRFVGGEQPHEQRPGQPRGQRHHGCERQPQPENVLLRLPYALCAVRAVIIA